MDAAAHYQSLVLLGRDKFLAASAPALLLRQVLHLWPPATAVATPITEMLREDEVTAKINVNVGQPSLTAVEVYPLEKKPAAAFPELITVGRTAHNDVVLINHTITRLHLYLTQRAGQWWVADAGSKNGTWLGGRRLQPHEEKAITGASRLQLGELLLTFHLAEDAYAALGGR